MVWVVYKRDYYPSPNVLKRCGGYEDVGNALANYLIQQDAVEVVPAGLIPGLNRIPLTPIDGSPLACPNINGGELGSINVAAARSLNIAVGTMDTSPTESEVIGLQQLLEFSAVDNVRAVTFLLAIPNPAVAAVLAVRCKLNGFDDYSDASALAAGSGDVITVIPNVITRIATDTPVTRMMVCGVPSSVGGGTYTGCRLFFMSESYD